MKKNRVMFVLRQFGSNGTENQEFYEALAKHFDAHLEFLEAPHECQRERGGKAWYHITPEPERKAVFDDQFWVSVKCICDKMSDIAVSDIMNCDDLILVGHSQGAIMALYTVLYGTKMVERVITLCPFIPDNFDEVIKNGGPDCDGSRMYLDYPIVWIEGGKDDLIPKELKESYKEIKEVFDESNADFTYIVNPETTHLELSMTIIDQLKELGIS